MSFVGRNYYKFFIKNGYVPKMFNPYNSTEVADIAPTQTTKCGQFDSSATVLILDDGCVNIEPRKDYKQRKIEKEKWNMKTWRLGNFCEFDKYAVKSYCTIHGTDETLI